MPKPSKSILPRNRYQTSTTLSYFEKLVLDLIVYQYKKLILAQKPIFKSDEIIFTPNGVDFDEYLKAIGYVVKITIDNLSI